MDHQEGEFELLELGYSPKNIPIGNRRQIRTILLDKTSKFLRNMRWRAWHFLNPGNEDIKVTYGFKSERAAPQVLELKEFEDKIITMVSNIEFKDSQGCKSEFQARLNSDIAKISSSAKMTIQADKSNNLYFISAEKYAKLLRDSITSEYKIAEEELFEEIIASEKEVSASIGLGNRMERPTVNNARITIKDHKNNFRTNTKCRLLNPSKVDSGRVSCEILARINTEARKLLKFNQWLKTTDVLEWFNRREIGRRASFIQFDIVNFYPSISKNLLDRSLEYLSKIVNIEKNELEIINSARKSLLHDRGTKWVKKGGMWDVPMGSWDGAEVCEAVGLYLLHKLQNLGIPLGLYRDDGLAICYSSPRQCENVKKQIVEIFKQEGLDVTADANMDKVDFLDVTLDIIDGTYKPFLKPGNNPVYVNVGSNHPLSVLRAIPSGVNKRLNCLSSDEKVFNEIIGPFQTALNEAGHNFKLFFYPELKSNKNKKSRKRNITWFNPPYCRSIKTDIGKQFNRIVSETFPPSHKLRKIFNCNQVKMSYSCLPNIGAKILKDSNKKFFGASDNNMDNNKDCVGHRKGAQCPVVNNICNRKDNVYLAEVRTGSKLYNYIGISAPPLRLRVATHLQSLKTENNQTELSNKCKDIAEKGGRYELTFKLLENKASYTPEAKICQLCNAEKFQIIFSNLENLINSKKEITSTCRHRSKFKLCNFKVP